MREIWHELIVWLALWMTGFFFGAALHARGLL